MVIACLFFFFFKQKTAYELRMSDWSSDVCSSDLRRCRGRLGVVRAGEIGRAADHLGDRRGQRVEREFGRAARRDLLRVGEPPGDRGRDRVVLGQMPGGTAFKFDALIEIGRESCGERVWQYG